MVHIKRVELSHFKSFGGTTQVPLLPGFTVISGPNGSGKSNILDALLFCLGLASSKGMRAERLPDLVNHNQSQNGRAVETIVSVTFDVSDVADFALQSLQSETDNNITDPEILANNPNFNLENKPKSNEWTVTRRLRVTAGGSYASTYYINGETCNVNELHEQLNRLRIYPEGYNVVLQGDVTRIITMNGKERREIIDELAGVAEFDRKINQTKQTLETVKEKEERCRIIEQELQKNLERLASDRIKAEKYQKLKAQLHEKQEWEIVINWQFLQQQQQELVAQINKGEAEKLQSTEQLNNLTTGINEATINLEQLNNRVKALGEDEQLSVASHLATQKAKRHQLQQHKTELINSTQQNQTAVNNTNTEITKYQISLTQLEQEKKRLETDTIPYLTQERNQARETLENAREQAHNVAAASEAWVQEQSTLSRQITALQEQINPQRTEQAQLNERSLQLQGKIEEAQELLQVISQELATKELTSEQLNYQVQDYQEQIQYLVQQLTIAEQEKQVQQDTQTRLLQEQREKQRQLDKLEATNQAQQEAQGTYATKVIFSANLAGVYGLVSQLGQVEPRYQLALEIAAGARLGYLVVEDDSVAAKGIELLKQKRAGRATFLPLNKIQSPRIDDVATMRYGRGFIDLAVNLINCEPRFRNIFAYVFGNTIVFENIDTARSFLGKQRIVTLEGDLLESSGAMTGGSQPQRSGLHFGTATLGESEEIQNLKKRLTELEQILVYNQEAIKKQTEIVQKISQELSEARQQGREQQLHLEQLQKDIQRLTNQEEQLTIQIQQNQTDIDISKSRLEILRQTIPNLEAELQQEQEKLAELEASQTHSEWQIIQKQIKVYEAELNTKEQALRQAEINLKDTETEYLRLEEKIKEAQQRLQKYQQQQLELKKQELELNHQLAEIDLKIQKTEVNLAQLVAKLGEVKQERDTAENSLKTLQNQQQKQIWQLEKLEETQKERRIALDSLQMQIEAQQAELPEVFPEIPESFWQSETGENVNLSEKLEQLQKEIRNLQKRIEALEPVNMLALEEYERTQTRLEELTEKLTTIEAERTELLLRVEKFTTLRMQAFKEAFDAVNENFKTIFATLSEGDGYLELEDAENPFNGGLNLIAHPKGKPVQRLSSMSGGEKSLTALSFIFSLQRYRPSPFYAFDEVDMFLDGANVERLSKMIRKQAEQAQFIVVSLRRPMIESSQRTIGVTQARGAYTQVLGIKL